MRTHYTFSLATLSCGLLIGFVGQRNGWDELLWEKEIQPDTRNREVLAMAGEETLYGPSRSFSAVTTAVALERILGKGSLQDQDRRLRELLSSVSLSDATKVLREIQDWSELHDVMGDVDASGAVHAAYETLADVLSEGHPETALESLLQFLETDQGTDPKAPIHVDQLMTAVFRRWATQNPSTALAYIEKHRSRLEKVGGHLQDDLTHDLVRLWMQQEPDKALSWVENIPSKEGQKALRSALAVLHFSDPARAGRLLKKHQNLPGRRMLTEQMTLAWAANDPKQALNWASGLDAEAARIAAPLAIKSWASEDFDSARSAFQALKKGDARDAASRTVSHHYWNGKGDYLGAAEMLMKEDHGPGRNAGVRDLIANWSQNDPEAAAEWLQEQLPKDGSLDEAVIEMSYTFSKTDPEQAAHWLSTLHDPTQRVTLLQQALDPWFRKSPMSTLEWIQNEENLNQQDRDVLLEKYQTVFSPTLIGPKSDD